MRLVKQSKGNWQYHLNHNEADILLGLVKKFPFTELSQIKISKTDNEPATVERGKLLNESLAEHRKALKTLAMNLLGNEKWQPSGEGQLLTLDSGSREILLQILNDIRVGCWHALGEPEVLESPAAHSSRKDLTYRKLMDLAGYFEMKFLEPEV
ncbi:MAG TPA: hypothetical protein VGI03_16575 [Verrucomicrobiae bacterium]|jgi:hypothetical protein